MVDDEDATRSEAEIQRELRAYAPLIEAHYDRAKKDPLHAEKAEKLKTILDLLQTE